MQTTAHLNTDLVVWIHSSALFCWLGDEHKASASLTLGNDPSQPLIQTVKKLTPVEIGQRLIYMWYFQTHTHSMYVTLQLCKCLCTDSAARCSDESFVSMRCGYRQNELPLPIKLSDVWELSLRVKQMQCDIHILTAGKGLVHVLRNWTL